MDSNSGGRYRRDYTDGLIRSRQAAALPPTPPPAKSAETPKAVQDQKPKAPPKKTVDIEITLTKLILGLVVLAVIVAGIFLLTSRHSPKSSQNNQAGTSGSAGGGQKSTGSSGYFPSSITKSQISIPAYYPVSLPAGFKVSGFSVIKQNVLYYIVTNKSDQKFYVTIQSLPSDFDFVAFAKKFPQPDQYAIPIGNALVGVAGSNLIGSVQTNKSVWILLNSANTSSQQDMETITRSFQQVQI